VYDTKNDSHEFVGTNRQDAIEQACQFFEMDAAELSISGFDDGSIYGLATRTVIVAIPKNRKASAPAPRRSDAPRGDEGGRDRDRDRGRGRERGRGRGRNDQNRQSSNDRQERPRSSGGNDRAPEPKAPEPKAAEPAAPSEASVGSSTGELGEIGDFVLGVMERMDLGAFEISESSDGELIVVEVKGEATRELAGGGGRVVDALQLLTNQASARIYPDRKRVVIDIEGNAEAREEFLTKLADRVAKRALQTGRAVALDPMSGRDRRTIHVALRDRDDVVTISEGSGRFRQVVVVPEGSDEFDEALEQSEQANSSQDD
jgi:predicted RNA-binding protein Jag